MKEKDKEEPEFVIKARPGSGLTDEEARLIYYEIKRLVKLKGGPITVDEMVEAASDLESPLHPFYTWDEAEAAEKWWQHTADMMRLSIREA